MDDATALALARAETAEQELDQQRHRAETAEAHAKGLQTLLDERASDPLPPLPETRPERKRMPHRLDIPGECKQTPTPTDRLGLMMELQTRCTMAQHILARCRQEIAQARRAVDLASKDLYGSDFKPVLVQIDDSEKRLYRDIDRLEHKLAVWFEAYDD